MVEAQIQFRPKRILVCRTRDGDQELTLRFFHFYPSQLRQLDGGCTPARDGRAQARLLRRRDDPSALRGAARSRAASRGAHARLSDHGRAGAAHPAQADRTGAGADRPRRYAARRRPDALEALPASATACATCTTRRPMRRRTSCRSARTRPGGASSSTNCWLSNSPCASTTGAGRRRMHQRWAARGALADRLLAGAAVQADSRASACIGRDPLRSGQAASHAASVAG